MASSGSSGCPTQPHVAFVAFPFGTHAAPLFALARAVASAAPGAAVSFLSTARSLASLPRAEGLGNIRLVPVADGRPEGAAEVPPPGGIEELIGMFLAATPGNLREALGAAAAGAGGIPVGCVVSDAFMWMAGDVAEAAGAPWVVLWTGGPAGLAAHLHTDLLRDAIGVGERAMTRFKEQLHSIPVLSAHRVCDLPEGIVFGPLDAPVSCLVHRMAQSLPKAAAVLHNTFEGLDPAIDAHFSATFSRSLPVGPLHLLAPPAHPTPDPNHCLPWLDRHAPATVAYVSFGSFMAPPPAEMTELAEGLEASGAAFLWSLRDEVMGLLPPGFSERTKGRGLVVSWAPQLDILRHAAVGAIVMHCGWNSVVEAITAGVPMVCRPFFGDQRLNARFIFQVWEIGVEFEGGVMTKEGVVRALEAVLKGEEGKRMRVKAGELKAIATRAVQPGGSSSVNFNSFLDLV